jgi:transcriptional regulator with XRE-family HTH domain
MSTERQTSATVVAVSQQGGVSLLRTRLGAALQKHRLRRGLTQSQLAEFANLSLKYVGEIERGSANTTLDALERLADAVGWDPMESLEGLREPISEGVRVMLISEVSQLQDRLTSMTRWLSALNPALHPHGRLAPQLPSDPADTDIAPVPPKNRPRARGRRRSSRARGRDQANANTVGSGTPIAATGRNRGDTR